MIWLQFLACTADMAIGNLFGSNLFNIFILALDDVFYTKGPLLAHVADNHVIGALAAMTMTAVAIAGLCYQASKKALFVSWDALGLATIYIFSLVVLYSMR